VGRRNEGFVQVDECFTKQKKKIKKTKSQVVGRINEDYG
jgi:hypothetical protein